MPESHLGREKHFLKYAENLLLLLTSAKSTLPSTKENQITISTENLTEEYLILISHVYLL